MSVEIILASRAQHRDKMPTGGRSPGAKPLRVEIESLGMKSQEADSCLAIFYRSGKAGLTTQPIFDGRHGESTIEQGEGRSAIFGPRFPTPSMHPDYQWRCRGSFGTKQVKPKLAIPHLAINEITFNRCSRGQV